MPVDADGAIVPIPPPDVDRPWAAEITWRQGSGRAQFVVMARADGAGTRAIAQSAALTWPPSQPEEIADLAGAAYDLADALLSAGWVEGEEGPAWYQRHFTWSTEPAPRAALNVVRDGTSTAHTPRRSPAVARTTEWPAWTEGLTRCQIEWRPGYRRSRFEVVLRRPGAKRGEPIGDSRAFTWTFMEPASRRDPEQVAAVQMLADALLERGWEEVDHGRPWYARRFVWRLEDRPAVRLAEPPPL